MLSAIKILPRDQWQKEMRKRIQTLQFFTLRMTSYDQALSIKANYLDFPRDGEILGPHHHSNFIPLSQQEKNSDRQYAKLHKRQEHLNGMIEEAKNQQSMMLELFESICRSEQQGFFLASKCKRRCAKDLIVRHYCPHQNCNKFYSAESALQRHIRTKHKTLGVDPPQKYHQLHPEPNLTHQQIYEDSEESAFALSSPIPQHFTFSQNA